MHKKLKSNCIIIKEAESSQIRLIYFLIIFCCNFSKCEFVTVQTPVGQTAILPCFVQIIGNVQVVWLSPSLDLVSYNEEIRMPDGRYSLLRQNNQEWNLQITNTILSDAGNYSCQVTLGKDVLKYQVQLVNLISPTARLNASYLEVRKEGEFTLECIATAFPQPSIQWHFYQFNQTKKIALLEYENSTLLKKILVSEFDAGKYVCFSSNGVAPVSIQNCYINILFEPQIKMGYTKIIQNRGSLLKMECLIYSYPQPKVTWSFSEEIYRDFKSINFEEKKNTSSFLSTENIDACLPKNAYCYSSVIIIGNALFEDAGFYRCETENLVGNSKLTVELSIQEENKFEIIAKPSDTSVYVGSQTILFCTINIFGNNKHNNSVTVTWFRTTPRGVLPIFKSSAKNQPAIKNIRVIGEYDLEVKNIGKIDEGLYTCQVGSHGNQFNFTMFLSVIELSSMQECEGSKNISNLNIILIFLLIILFIAFAVLIIILLHHLKKINLKFFNQC